MPFSARLQAQLFLRQCRHNLSEVLIPASLHTILKYKIFTLAYQRDLKNILGKMKKYDTILKREKRLFRKRNMSIYFQSICSSSSGNCLALWSDTTKLVIDCGLSSMKRTRHALTTLFNDPAQIDSVLLTHMHGDHISYYPLRVLEDYGLTIRLHDDSMGQLKEKHFNSYGFKNLNILTYKNKKFTVGDFCIKPFEVMHNPSYPTYGYQIHCQDKKIIIVTDFLDWESVFDHFIDADFIFVESNHDLELLRKYFNPNSRFHMPNPDTAELILNIRKESKKAPQMIMLGHLSSQRNEPKIAIKETQDSFRDAGVKMDFELKAAPLRDAGEVVFL